MKRQATTKIGAIAIAIAALLTVLTFVSMPTPAKAASTVNFTCMQQSAALALINANPPGGVWPDGTNGTNANCPGEYDGYYTPSATTTTITSSATLPSNAITGTGTYSVGGTASYSLIPATGCAAGIGTCVETCSGPALVTGPTTSTTSFPQTPQLVTYVRTFTDTGVITTNTQGSGFTYNLVDGCVNTATSASIGTVTSEFEGDQFENLSNVTVCTAQPEVTPCPAADQVTGGLTIDTALNFFEGPNPTTTSTSQEIYSQTQFTVTGSGGLAGVTGQGVRVNNQNNPVTWGAYWVILYNVP